METARRNLLDFTCYTFPKYKVNWHHRAICETLDRWLFGDIDNLMLFTPPRRGKSELVSRRLPAFLFGHNPDAKIIAASYAATLIESMNRDCQNIIADELYAELFPDTYLSGKNVRNLAYGHYLRNSTEFQIVGHTGYYKCAGVGGGLTGRGFEYGIIDDPVKDAKEAESAVTRNAVWEWYTKVFLTRGAPNAKECVTMTRWHEDDLAGRIIQSSLSEENAKHWHILVFPEFYEQSHDLFELAAKTPHLTIVGQEYDKREEGAVLWPDHFSKEHSKEMRQTQGARAFGSLYQQRPSAAGGDVIKREWFRYYENVDGLMVYNRGGEFGGDIHDQTLDPNKLLRFSTVDLAASLRESADYFVMASWACTRDALFLLDVFRGRIGGERIIPVLKAEALKRYPMTHWVEKVGFQLAIIQQARDANVPVLEYIPIGDKLARAYAAAPMMERGEVYFNKNAPYLAEFEHELLSFPGGLHDDQVDVLTSAVDIHNSKLYASGIASQIGAGSKPWAGAGEVMAIDPLAAIKKNKAQQRTSSLFQRVQEMKVKDGRSNIREW